MKCGGRDDFADGHVTGSRPAPAAVFRHHAEECVASVDFADDGNIGRNLDAIGTGHLGITLLLLRLFIAAGRRLLLSARLFLDVLSIWLLLLVRLLGLL